MEKNIVIRRILIALALMMLIVTAALASEPIELVFAAQEEGTAAYQYAFALQMAMEEGLPAGSDIRLTEDSPGGVGAPVVISRGDADLIMSNSAPGKWSYEEGILGNEKTENIAALAGGLGHDFINVMFTQKFVSETGISTVEELVERQYPVRLIIKKDGTLGELSAERVFEALGVTFEDIVSWGGVVEKTSGDNIKEGLQDDLYDMTVDHIGVGQSNTTALCLTHDMLDVQMGDALLAKLVEMGYDYITVEPYTWNGQTEEIKTVGSQQCILVNQSMDEELAYLITKSVCEERDLLAALVPAMANFDPEKAGNSAVTGVPLHPGAARYYREMGYID